MDHEEAGFRSLSGRALRGAVPVAAVTLLCLGSQSTVAQEADAAPAESGPFLFTAARLLAAEPDRVDEALDLFERAVAADPDAPFLRIGLAEFLAEKLRRFDEAAEHTSVAYRLAPDDVDVLRAHAVVLVSLPGGGRRGEVLDQAIEALERLRRLAPSDIDGMMLLYRIRERLEEYEEAASVLEELVSYHNGHRQLQGLLVDAFRRAGRDDRAEAVRNEMLRLDGLSLEARMELAHRESQRGNHTEAIELLEGAVAEHPENIAVRGALAEEYFRRGVAEGTSSRQRAEDLAEALDRLRALPRAARADPRARLLEARILAESGRTSEAIELLENLTRESRDNPRIVREAVPLLMREGEWSRIRDIGQRLVDRADRSTDEGSQSADLGLSLLVEALRQLGELDEALEVLEAEEQRAGESAELVLSQAELLAEAGRKRRAMAMLRRDAVANDRLLRENDDGEPELPALVRKARLYFDLGADRLALRVYEDLAADGDVRRLMLVSESCREQGLFRESIPFLLRALARIDAGAETGLDVERDALRAALRYQLGEAYERSRRYDEAADQFQAVLALQPENSHAMNYLGYMWADNGENLEQALELIRRAVDLDPNNGAFVDSLGWALFRLGEFEQARRHLERANQLVPRDSTILEHLGDVYVALGDPQRAREAYEQALAINDEENVESVRRKLSELSRR
ncbi:MAG: tetratricopeptide repeat protein [Acidobacteriota bacterium]|nr:tetratricopeptide repeat protein [Acidobacteriota bacterium]MDE2922227.1 tetratricopeptide repeat protein [Acidobacteriota bacterium]MDE3265272.1 tetratricopeptide repeat protein [Acidobacteriota bacterium]